MKIFFVVSILSLLFFQQLVQAKTVQKIIALSPHSVEMLYAIGAGDRIIATLEYSDYPEEALKIPRIGNYTGIQIEKIIELQPDLIIGWKSGNKTADLKKIESLGFNIFYSHPQNIDEITLELIKLGELTGLQENAEAASTRISAKYHALKKHYQQYSKVRVFYQLWHDPLRTIGPNNWNESLINDCNGINVFHDASTTYP
ncbi:MAG: ABC transporter substrate-binding protein, partial [Gammaproteobacteria bacterium]|nr:ABC transporter substrate-binding protein [Gammaproteobacteria bacterium]